MKNLKPVLLAAIALVIIVVGVSALSNKISYAPSQTTTAQEENLDSDLNALDATDLDTGTNAQLDQLSSDSSSF